MGVLKSNGVSKRKGGYVFSKMLLYARKMSERGWEKPQTERRHP